MTVRYYSSVAAETTLSGAINNAVTTMTLGSTVGLPTSYPFTLAIDYGSAGEELVDVLGVSGNVITSMTRGVDGTSATSHNAAARVRHVASARDYADSRAHENADDGVHGMSPGEEIVGTMKVQTLSNKTLDDATGTLERVDIKNTAPAWVTTVYGDATTPGTSLFQFKPTNVANNVATITYNGSYSQRNKSATEDASNAIVNFSSFKSDGTTPIWRVLSGGEMKLNLSTGANGISVIPASDGTSQPAFRSRNAADSTDRVRIDTNGTASITGQDPATNQLTVVAAAGQTAATPVIRVRNSTPTTVASINPDGTFSGSRLIAGISNNPAIELSDPATGSSDRYLVMRNSSGVEVASIRRDGDAYFERIFQDTTGISFRTQQTGSSTTSFTAENSKTVAVLFSTAFPSAPTVMATKSNAPGGSRSIIVSAINVTTTGFDLLFQTADGLNTTFTNLSAAWSATGPA